MKKRFTPEETHIRQTLAKVRGYPRWKSTSITGGFLYYVGLSSWVEEVFPYFNGTWSAGRKSKGTIRYFKSLREALAYGEELAVPKVRSYNARQEGVHCMVRSQAYL
jgi:hypothetical protein